MNDKQKIAYLIQAVKDTMVTINDLDDDQELAKQAGHYELNIIATLLHDAEIINNKDFLRIVELFPIVNPFTKR